MGILGLAGTVSGQTAFVLAGDGLPVVARFALLFVAFAGFAALFTKAVRHAVLTPARVVVAAGTLLIVAVATPPTGHDIWSYASYGRIVSQHGASPYTHIPADFPHDPLLHLVGWRRTPSVYGPLFVGVAALGTSVTGASPVRTRVFFQGLEALAVVAAMLLVWRRTRDPAALAFVGLNPALVAAVTDGHNDPLVGLAVLAGAVLIADRRPVAAGTALAAGALVKIVALLPLGALVLWAWSRWGRRAAGTMGATAGAWIVVAYAAAGGVNALTPVLDAAGVRTSRSSIWGLAGLGGTVTGTLALVLIGGLVVFVLVTAARRVSAPWLAGAVLLCFLLGSQYVLPWYAAWGLPVLALVWRSPLGALAVADAGLLALAYSADRGTGGLFHPYYSVLVPVGSLAGIVVVVIVAARTRRPAGPPRCSGAGPAARAGGVAG